MHIDAGACGYIADGSPGRPQTIGTNPHPPASISAKSFLQISKTPTTVLHRSAHQDKSGPVTNAKWN